MYCICIVLYCICNCIFELYFELQFYIVQAEKTVSPDLFSRSWKQYALTCFFFISLLRIDLLTRVTREKLLSGQALGRSDWSDITRAVFEECAAKLGRYVVVRITLTTAYTRLRRSFLVAFKLRFCFVYRTPGHMTVWTGDLCYVLTSLCGGRIWSVPKAETKQNRSKNAAPNATINGGLNWALVFPDLRLCVR